MCVCLVCVACIQWSEVGRTNTGASLSSVVNTAENITVAIRDAQWLVSMSQTISLPFISAYFDNV